MGYCATDVAAESIVSRSRAGRARPFGRFAEDSTLPMTLLLAAVGATGAALFELTVGPYLRIGGAQPHFVLVLGIVLGFTQSISSMAAIVAPPLAGAVI